MDAPLPLSLIDAEVRAYRDHVAQHERRLALVDLAMGGEDRDLFQGLDLLGLFVPQNAQVARPPGLGLGAPRQAVLSVSALVGQQPFCLVMGGPGSGKTALGRWLALKLCTPGESLPALGSLGASLVPVRVELRRYDERRQASVGTNYDFLSFLEEEHTEKALPLRGAILRALAAAGRLFWIFDGLDEVPEPAQRCYGLEIVDLCAQGARGLLTSRPVGTEQAAAQLQERGIPAFRLLSFDDQQIEAFLDRWHTLAFPGREEVAARRRQRLAAALRESASLRELAKVPLLLTLIALLNRGGALPRARHRLYERAVELCAQQWEANKHLDHGADPLELRDKLQLLRRIAWQMMTELPGGTGNLVQARAVRDSAAAFCEERFAEEATAAMERAALLVQGLQERNELLTTVGGQTLSFLHRAFLEYLAASEVLSRYRGHRLDQAALAALFRARWRDPAWAETLYLLCGMLAEDSPETVMTLLQEVLGAVPALRPGVGDTLEVQRWAAFAVRALAEGVPVEQEPLRGFCQRLMELIEAAVLGSDLPPLPALFSALRRFGPRWPQQERWTEVALRCQKDGAVVSAIGDPWLRAAKLALSASEPGQRTALLKVLLQDRSEFDFVDLLRQAQASGAWTAAEALELLHACAPCEDPRWADLCADVLGNLESGAEVVLTGALQQEFAQASPQHRLRLAKALEMLPSGHRGSELAVLSQEPAAQPVLTMTQAIGPRWEDLWGRLVDQDPRVRAEAARVALTGLGEAVIRLVAIQGISFRQKDPRSLEETIDMGASPGMMHLYVRNFADLLSTREEAVATMLARVLLAKLHRVWRARGPDLFAEVQQSGNPVLRQVARLWSAPGAVKGELQEWLKLLGSILIALLPEAPPPPMAAALEELARGSVQALVPAAEAMLSEKSAVAVDLAAVIPFASSALESLMKSVFPPEAHEDPQVRGLLSVADELRQAVLHTLRRTAHTGTDECMRVASLLALHHLEPSAGWLETLHRAAADLKDPVARLRAGRALSEESLLISLSQDAGDDQVRREAYLALTVLRLARILRTHGRRRRGTVSLAGQRVGVLEETAAGSRFIYDAAWRERPGALAVSPTLPLRPEPYEEKGLLSFFANLLPEGWLLERTCAKLNLDSRDDFGLLLATGEDLAGAVEVRPQAEP